MPGKPDKTSHFSAYLGNLGGEKFMTRVLFVCHGKKLLLERKFAKSRVVGFGKRIFIPDLYQKIKDLGL